MRLKGLGNLVTAAQQDLLMVEMGSNPNKPDDEGEILEGEFQRNVIAFNRRVDTSTRLFLFLTPVIELSKL